MKFSPDPKAAAKKFGNIGPAKIYAMAAWGPQDVTGSRREVIARSPMNEMLVQPKVTGGKSWIMPHLLSPVPESRILPNMWKNLGSRKATRIVRKRVLESRNFCAPLILIHHIFWFSLKILSKTCNICTIFIAKNLTENYC